MLFKGISDKSKLPLDYLIGNEGLFIQIINKSQEKASLKDVEEYRNEEIIVSIVLCLDTLIEDSSSITNVDYLRHVGESLIGLMYSATAKDYGEIDFCTLISTCLGTKNELILIPLASKLTFIADVLRKISETSKDFGEQHMGQLLGAVKAFMVRGLSVNEKEATPKPLAISQQSLFEPNDLVIKKGGKAVKKRRHRNNKSGNTKKILDDDPIEFTGPASLYNGSRVNWDYVPGIVSASEVSVSQSETEGGGTSGKLRHQQRSKQSQLRLSCTMLMERLCKTVDRKTMFGYWNNFVPQEYSEDAPKPMAMLPWLLLIDPNPKCRCMVAQTLSTFIRFSKFYLYQAESDQRTSNSFTAFSVSLGQSIIATYRILTKALSSESNVGVIIQILKCFSSLIQATPFHKLDSGMISNVVKYVRKLVHHKDLDIKVSSLVIIGFLLAVPEKTVEIKELLGLSSGDRGKAVHARDEEEEGADEDFEVEQEWCEAVEEEQQGCSTGETSPRELKTTEMSWILRIVLDLLSVKISDLKTTTSRLAPPTPLKVECLHILLAMTSHPELLRDNLRYFTDAAIVALDDPSPECHLFAVRVIDYTGYALSHNLESASGTGPGLEECIEFWFTVIPLIAGQLQKPSCLKYATKPICCDALSNVGGAVFEKMPQKTKAFLIALLQGCFYGETPEVDGGNLLKASAGRALAVLALYPSLRSDLAFIETTSEMIVSLFQDKNSLVRKKCTWSLGNILEALVEMQSKGAELSVNGSRIGDQYLERFFVACLRTTDDHEKVRSNIMRCLGNLVLLLTDNHMREESGQWRKFAMRSVQAVVENALNFKAVKVKWNACYSLGLMMRNEEMYAMVEDQDLDWPSLAFPALSKLMSQSPNFKVRTAAVIAVSVPKKRQLYGRQFISIWEALIGALEQAGNLIDFNEYKHRDNLLDQLCTSISHFILICDVRDLVAMKLSLVPQIDLTKQNWFRVINRILPEQGACLISAANKLKEMEKNNSRLSPDIRESVALMATCFVSPVEYE